MRWTVRNKLMAMGLLVLVGLAALTGVSYRTNVLSAAAGDQLEVRTEQVEKLNQFKQALLALNLAAMDAIVDRAAGDVGAEVMSEITDSSRFVRGHVDEMVALADTEAEIRAAEQVRSALPELLRTVEQQLVQAIRSRAEDQHFAELDDLIDSRLSRMLDEVDLILQAVQQESREATQQLHDELYTANTLLVSIVVGVLLLLLPAGITLFRSIVGPLRRAMAMLSELEAGHLSARLNLTSPDEIGDMARSMDAFADSLQHEVVANLQLLAQGDLRFEVTPRDGQDELRTAVKQVAEDLQRLLEQVQQACDQIATGSSEVSDSSQALSQGATESASSLEQIAASMNEMASQTRHNAENASQANQLSQESKQAAERGNDQMGQMVAAMGEINEAGQNISKIIKVIDEIAFQTNLLALNAAVEAARAGQHGKGFAVVAEEVRNLAARSAKAANETSELIEGSVKKAANGAEIADVTAAGLAEIVDGITKVSDLVGEITAASNEQAQGISQVNQGLGQIDQVTQQNTASAEQGAAASEELSSQAEHLRQLIGHFKLKGQGAPARLAAPPSPTARPSAPTTAARWGSGVAPAQIALDDDEFGKY